MWKQEFKEELKLFKKVNEALTSKICYLLLEKEDYKMARSQDWLDDELIQKEIDLFDTELLNTKEALHNHYFNNYNTW